MVLVARWVWAACEGAFRPVEEPGELFADEGHRDVAGIERPADDADDLDIGIIAGVAGTGRIDVRN